MKFISVGTVLIGEHSTMSTGFHFDNEDGEAPFYESLKLACLHWALGRVVESIVEEEISLAKKKSEI